MPFLENSQMPIKKINQQERYALTPKRTSKRALLSASAQANFTIEASLLTPLFIIFVVFLLFPMLIINNQIFIQKALNDAAISAAQGYFVADRISDLTISNDNDTYEALATVATNALSVTYIRNAVKSSDYIDKAYLLSSYSLDETWIDTDNAELYVSITYKIISPTIFNYFDITKKLTNLLSYTQTAVVRGFTGVSLNDEDNEVMVYITKYGTVYHKSASCTYLTRFVEQSSSDCIFFGSDYTMISGALSYTPCPNCCADKIEALIASGKEFSIYTCSYGYSYHLSQSCSYIDRTIYHVPLESVRFFFKPCSKCYGSED